VLEVEMHLVRPRIELLGPVERYGADAIGDVVENRFIRHPGSPHVHSCGWHDEENAATIQTGPDRYKWHRIGD
jgi:hypothetical protein